MDGIIDGLPAAYYTDSAIYQAERQLIFARNWLYAGHVDELPENGSFLSISANKPGIGAMRKNQT